ncbi:MAG: thiamine-phosphate kinase [Bacteroidales bacterium]|nr:thiamine-phosphate kinase [Bacteroidales bacterium]
MEENKETTRTELDELGEFGLIDQLTQDFPLRNASSLKGVGDDAAVINHEGYRTLVSVDLLVEGVHFDMIYTPLKHLGYKAAVVNFSDIYAMNGTPTQIVVGLGVSNRYSVEALDELYAGIRLACEEYHVDMVGGDTTSSQTGLVISITVIGMAKEEEVVYRSGAKPNDLLCVSGDLGGAYMGLLVLEREKAEFLANPNMQPQLSDYSYVLERQLKPEARKDIIARLKELGIKPTSMIDISDGLASEVLHLCKESGVGCQLYEGKIPQDPGAVKLAQEFQVVPSIAALNGGEDYELLFTIDQKDYEKILKMAEDVTVIGYMTADKGITELITPDYHVFPLEAQGWNHFREVKG